MLLRTLLEFGLAWLAQSLLLILLLKLLLLLLLLLLLRLLVTVRSGVMLVSFNRRRFLLLSVDFGLSAAKTYATLVFGNVPMIHGCLRVPWLIFERKPIRMNELTAFPVFIMTWGQLWTRFTF